MFFKDNFFILNGSASELLYKPLMGSRFTKRLKEINSPAFWDTDRSPATSPSKIPAKHIWKPNNSFRFLRLALLLRWFSIIPAPPAPATAVSGIPSTTMRVMAL